MTVFHHIWQGASIGEEEQDVKGQGHKIYGWIKFFLKIMQPLKTLYTRGHIITMSKDGSTKTVKFMVPGSVVLALGRGFMANTVKPRSLTRRVQGNNDEGVLYVNCKIHDPLGQRLC